MPRCQQKWLREQCLFVHKRKVVVELKMHPHDGSNNQMNYQIINHIIIKTTLTMEKEAYAQRLTALTLIAAAVGIVSAMVHWAFAIIFVPILLVPKFVPLVASHGWKVVAQMTLTTFCFGIIDGLALLEIMVYFQKGREGPVPLMQAYLCFLTIYHYFQFQMVNCFHHNKLSWNAFLIYHSKPYMIANAAMILEHIVTKYLIGLSYKDDHMFIILGLIMMVVGEGLRIAAFFTCRKNFTHLVRYTKVPGHQLVTNGIYSIFRHPSYTGYFYFSVGGQIFLGNVLCSVLFAIALIKFFRQRIQDQQIALTNFFPEYPAYQSRTWICIPFVHGVPPEKLRQAYEFQD